jgi:protein TonB
MGPARSDYRSRGTAAVAAVAFHIAFIFLLTSPLRQELLPESAPIEPMLVKFVDRPRGQHQDSVRRAIAPRLSRPTVRLADTPPNVAIVIPVEIPPAPEPSVMLAGLPPGSQDVVGAGSSSGSTEGAGEGSGPAIVHTVPPLYSAASARAHEHGTVAVRVLVDAQGAPSQIRLARSSGFPRLDESATEAVKRYRFKPATRQAQPHQSWTTVAVEFDLLRMPVPTSLVWFNAVIAEQVAFARRSRAGAGVDVHRTDELVHRLAERLFDRLLRDGAAESDPQHPSPFPTPLKGLAAQGKLRHIRFVGFASPDFDCGNPDMVADAEAISCEVFEAQLDSGLSYWLALVENSRLQLKNVLITAGTESLSARSGTSVKIP